ncbi:hypothetical protein [Mannheimia massilioguelmaensis]|uniref:hypothetical protein n=1 Tax=Mannheimia massilioguelmaensis TaxID=1604354 RepID=UPI0005CA518F|nr:hypothetical protein [Mannheimia massilioguelmaensis]
MLKDVLDSFSAFGTFNASRDQVTIWDMINTYNTQNLTNRMSLDHVAHSLGASSTKNAMNWVEYKGIDLNDTTLKGYVAGTSYPTTNSTIGGRLSLGLYDQGYVEKAAGLFKDGKITYTVASRDIVATGLGLPYQIGSLSFGIGNTNTTGSHWTGIPLWGIIAGDHTKAYYRDEDVINFLNPSFDKESEKNRQNIIHYQKNVWGSVGPKTEIIRFDNKIILGKEKENK